MSKSIIITKRLMDIFLSTLGILLTLPLYPIIAAMIKVDSKGPVFFKQKRVGLINEREIKYFNIAKFRTMRANAEEKSGPVWAKDNDPRITRAGRILRKARFDEIPQLFNVLKGEMSMVGPRPERPYFVEKLDKSIPHYSKRIYNIKPGITGLAQISCDYDTSEESVKEKLYYDHAYTIRITTFMGFLRTDLGIMLNTILVMIRGKGAK